MKIKINNFNLKDTVTCGQIFRYIEEDDNSYTVLLKDRVINIKKENDFIIVESNNNKDLEKVVRYYFDLDYDYESINNKIINIDKNNIEIINSCKGLKMINEPKYEVIISYILSANNGVPQIRNALNNISKEYGNKVIFNNKEYYLFPEIEKLYNLTSDDFRKCKSGFRDKYLYEIVQKIKNNEFSIESIEKMNSNDALKYLMENKGIGEKVASCILLFGYHRFDVFPIDTWVKKFMKERYNTDNVKEIRNIMKRDYGEYCGLMIQYIFNYSRNIKK